MIGLQYIQVGDFLIPNLTFEKEGVTGALKACNPMA